MKGVTLTPGTVGVLSLDGTLVYIEAIEQTFAGVVALPDQPTDRKDERVFTPGRVGMKKISPFSEFDKTVPIEDLTQRNKDFIGTFEKLRSVHGPNFVDRTPEEEAAYQAQANPPDKGAARAAKKAERAAAKEAKKKNGARYLLKCQTCGQQPGHPNHPDDHAFVPPPGVDMNSLPEDKPAKQPKPPKAPPVILCVACDETDEGNEAHRKDKSDGGHRFVAGKVQRTPRVPKDPAAPKPPKTPRPSKPTKDGVDVNAMFKWVGTDASLEVMRAGNPKFKSKNSGGAIVDAFAATPALSVTAVMTVLAQHDRWSDVPVDRVQLAFGQLLEAKLIEAA